MMLPPLPFLEANPPAPRPPVIAPRAWATGPFPASLSSVDGCEGYRPFACRVAKGESSFTHVTVHVRLVRCYILRRPQAPARLTLFRPSRFFLSFPSEQARAPSCVLFAVFHASPRAVYPIIVCTYHPSLRLLILEVDSSLVVTSHCGSELGTLLERYAPLNCPRTSPPSSSSPSPFPFPSWQLEAQQGRAARSSATTLVPIAGARLPRAAGRPMRRRRGF